MKTNSPYLIERLETIAQLEELEKDWKDLIDGISAVPIFLSWEWIRTWWNYFGQDRKLWLLTARNKNGILLGIAPLMIENNNIGWHKLRKLAFIGSGLISPLHFNILAQKTGQEELCQAFLEYLLSESDQWDILSFTPLAQDSPLSDQLAKIGGQIRVGKQKVAPYVPLPDSWETYLTTVSKKLRRNLKYFHSKLENDNPDNVTFTRVKDPQELINAMKKLEELNRLRWHSKGLSTAFDDATFSSFHQTIACLALDQGWLRLYTLTVMDKIIALFYCFRFKECVYAYQMAFDLDWSGYSPGRLLIAHGIRDAIQESATELDWGSGDSDYKLAWTDQVRTEYEIVLSSNWQGSLWIKYVNLQGFFMMKAKQVLSKNAKNRLKQIFSKKHISNTNRNKKDSE